MKRRKRTNIKSKLLKILLIVISIIVIGVFIYFAINKDIFKEEEKLDTTPYYSEFIITNKESDIYIKENEEYKKAGVIGKNVELSLNEVTNPEEPYFNIKDFLGTQPLLIKSCLQESLLKQYL